MIVIAKLRSTVTKHVVQNIGEYIKMNMIGCWRKKKKFDLHHSKSYKACQRLQHVVRLAILQKHQRTNSKLVHAKVCSTVTLYVVCDTRLIIQNFLAYIYIYIYIYIQSYIQKQSSYYVYSGQ